MRSRWRCKASIMQPLTSCFDYLQCMLFAAQPIFWLTQPIRFFDNEIMSRRGSVGRAPTSKKHKSKKKIATEYKNRCLQIIDCTAKMQSIMLLFLNRIKKKDRIRHGKNLTASLKFSTLLATCFFCIESLTRKIGWNMFSSKKVKLIKSVLYDVVLRSFFFFPRF